jgi:hypothetical protein
MKLRAASVVAPLILLAAAMPGGAAGQPASEPRVVRCAVIVGYIPARLGKMNPAGMEILVRGDPAMRRPFIVMEANPQRFPQANHAGARALSDFLLSPKVQSFLAEFGQKTTGRGPLFHPVAAPPETR